MRRGFVVRGVRGRRRALRVMCEESELIRIRDIDRVSYEGRSRSFYTSPGDGRGADARISLLIPTGVRASEVRGTRTARAAGKLLASQPHEIRQGSKAGRCFARRVRTLRDRFGSRSGHCLAGTTRSPCRLGRIALAKTNARTACLLYPKPHQAVGPDRCGPNRSPRHASLPSPML